MGRPKGSFTVAKSFTIGLKEAAWIEEKMQKGKKASEVINDLIQGHNNCYAHSAGITTKYWLR